MGAFVEAAGERVVVGDVPEAVGDFFEADVFMVQRLAEEVLARVQTEGPGAADFADLELAGILRWGDAFGIRSR